MKLIRPAIVLFIALTIITGAVYPAIVTAVAKGAFVHQADGSIITQNGKEMGSSLIAQQFTDPKYFWSRPSAAGYDATAGSGSNMGPTNPALFDAIKSRVDALHAADPGNTTPIPIDLVTASASGLDPHITLAAAKYQAARIAKARNVPVSDVERLIDEAAESPALGILGDSRVNVLQLNLSLDQSHASGK